MNRMKTVLNAVISSNHSAFIPGQCVVDNVILGYECIHSLRFKTGGKTGWVALQLDMSKAYDRIECSFLEQIMLNMGYASL